MGFRDDNEALRARAKAADERARRLERDMARLEAELREARADDAADEAEIRRLREQLRALGHEARPTTSTDAATGARARWVIAGTVLAVAAVVALVFALSRQPPDARPAPPEAASQEGPAAASSPAGPAITPLDRVRLGGVVEAVDGVDGVAVGDGCVVDQALAREGRGPLEVRCGGRTVFRSSEPTGAGMSRSGGRVYERPVGDARVARSLDYELVGSWSGPQAQIQLDPRRHGLRIWREGLDETDLRVHVEGAAASEGQPLVRRGLPTAVSRVLHARLAPVEHDLAALSTTDPTGCTLRLEPIAAGGPFITRALVRCADRSTGTRALYGAGTGGWLHGEARDGVVQRAVDEAPSATDEDPRFEYDGETVTVADDGWFATFRVEPHPRCSLTAGRWTGAVRLRDGALRTGVVLADHALRLPSRDAPIGVTESADCRAGVVQLSDEEGDPVAHGHFGPEMAVFVGRLHDGSLLELVRDPR